MGGTEAGKPASNQIKMIYFSRIIVILLGFLSWSRQCVFNRTEHSNHTKIKRKHHEHHQQKLRHRASRFGIELEIVGISMSQTVEALRNAGIRVETEGYNHDTKSYWSQRATP